VRGPLTRELRGDLQKRDYALASCREESKEKKLDLWNILKRGRKTRPAILKNS